MMFKKIAKVHALLGSTFKEADIGGFFWHKRSK